MEGKEELLTKSSVKERGWTEGLIARFLLHPDQTKQNPHYKSGPPMKLYRLDRVEEAEASPIFQDAAAGLARRRQGAKKAVATKRAKTEAYFDRVRISVPRLSEEKLTKRACDHYNAMQLGRSDMEWYASERSDPEFLERISVNYLRHEMSSYEYHLARVAGQVGAEDAYWRIKEKMLDAITEAYPQLAAECRRQMVTA